MKLSLQSSIPQLVKLGGRFNSWLTEWRDVGKLLATALKAALSISFYRNSASRSVLSKQIYFTAMQILPVYCIFAAALSYVAVHVVTQFAADYGVGGVALEITVKVLILDALPLLTAMFVALRSGAATGAEVALMNVGREFESMRSVGVDPLHFELIPRIVASIISVFTLNAIGGVLSLVVAYVATYGANSHGAAEFSRAMSHIFYPTAVASLAFKVLAFGMVVLTVPIAAAMNTPQKLFMAPIALLRGMVRLFLAIMVIEALPMAVSAL